MSYMRVIPRDLFNEAKLLKCLGKITLFDHDRTLQGLNINHEDESRGFNIEQDSNTGNIYVSNLHFFDDNGTPIYFFHPLNNKSEWPLQMEYKDEIYFCFDKKGDWLPDINIFKKASNE